MSGFMKTVLKNEISDDIKIRGKVSPFSLPRPFISPLSLVFTLLHGLEAA